MEFCLESFTAVKKQYTHGWRHCISNHFCSWWLVQCLHLQSAVLFSNESPFILGQLCRSSKRGAEVEHVTFDQKVGTHFACLCVKMIVNDSCFFLFSVWDNLGTCPCYLQRWLQNKLNFSIQIFPENKMSSGSWNIYLFLKTAIDPFGVRGSVDHAQLLMIEGRIHTGPFSSPSQDYTDNHQHIHTWGTI